MCSVQTIPTIVSAALYNQFAGVLIIFQGIIYSLIVTRTHDHLAMQHPEQQSADVEYTFNPRGNSYRQRVKRIIRFTSLKLYPDIYVFQEAVVNP
jgi:hypothetical protein